MATAALRGLLVVAALALGLFVLSKAFPSGETAPTGTPGGPADTLTSPPVTSPSPAESPIRQVPQPLNPEDITVQVLNGTEVSGLAADTAEILEEAGYDIRTIDDAETTYDVTTINYVKKRKLDAQILQQQFFPSAKLEIAAEDVKVDITVNIGSDYAESLDTGAGGATSEETPS